MHRAGKRLEAGAGRGRKWTPGGDLPAGGGTGAVPGRRGHGHARELPAPGDLRASRRDVEVHRVAEVAALRAAVHRQLVHVQVERLGAGRPQHPQGRPEAAAGRERRRPAAPGTAAGPCRHRRPPWRLLAGERDPRWEAAGVAAGGPQMPAARLGARGVSVRGDSPGAPPRGPCGLRPAAPGPLVAGSGAGPEHPALRRQRAGRARSRRLLAAGPRAARGSPRLRASPAPAGRRRQAPVWAPGFLLQLHLQDDLSLVRCQCKPLLSEGMLPAQGESFLPFVPNGRRWKRTAPRGKIKRPLCITSAV